MGKGRDAYKYGKNHLIGSGSDGLGKSATSCQDTYDLISNIEVLRKMAKTFWVQGSKFKVQGSDF
jgi:hypothetical protein